MESFCFKKFSIRQSGSAMKVNTDGVLLGAWLTLPESNNFRGLDIGTGTGVIALITAQRLTNENSSSNIKSSEGKNRSFFIEAIDIDTLSAEEANFNFSQSQWKNHLEAYQISLQNLIKAETHEKYALIMSNPPYFIDSLKAPSARRSSARHNHELPYEVIIEAATKMLKTDGRLAIVLPADEGEKFISTCEKTTTLRLARRCRVKTLAGKKEKRYLLEFVNEVDASSTPIEEVLIMQETGGLEYTEQYMNLTKDFYLRF
jgi:tRNA1Val (adenine37-N6)-methyltransferase